MPDDPQAAIIARLWMIGARRSRFQAELAIAEAELLRTIEEALDIGVPKRAIAREAGVSRTTVYNVQARRGVG